MHSVDKAVTNHYDNLMYFLQEWRAQDIQREAITPPVQMYTSPEIYR